MSENGSSHSLSEAAYLARQGVATALVAVRVLAARHDVATACDGRALVVEAGRKVRHRGRAVLAATADSCEQGRTQR